MLLKSHTYIQLSGKITKIMEKSIQPARNIEIKAKLESDDEYVRRVLIAKELTKTDGEHIQQHDVFYKANNGRLKLRFLQVRFFQNS